MKRKILLLITVIGITLALQADDYDTQESLNKKRSDLLVKIHNKRVELIKKTPSLMELQKKIMALHKELAIRIDNNEEMRELIDELRAIETKMKALNN